MTRSSVLVEPVGTTVALDAGTTVAAAEQLLHDLEERLGAEAVLATTHFVDGRVVVVGEWAGVVVPDDLAATTEAASTARRRHAERTSGRLVRYAGRAGVERETTVGAVVSGSAIDEVVALGGVPLEEEAALDLREWARPELRAGRVVLVVQPGAGGLVPFESREQRPCCSAH